MAAKYYKLELKPNNPKFSLLSTEDTRQLADWLDDLEAAFLRANIEFIHGQTDKAARLSRFIRSELDLDILAGKVATALKKVPFELVLIEEVDGNEEIGYFKGEQYPISKLFELR